MAKVLVAYFSATGTTGAAATALAEAACADLYEIIPEQLYTNDDLNWRNEQSRSSVEMKDLSSRPGIGGEKIQNMDQYDTIFLCFPIWWCCRSVVQNLLTCHWHCRSWWCYRFFGKNPPMFRWHCRSWWCFHSVARTRLMCRWHCRNWSNCRLWWHCRHKCRLNCRNCCWSSGHSGG